MKYTPEFGNELTKLAEEQERNKTEEFSQEQWKAALRHDYYSIEQYQSAARAIQDNVRETLVESMLFVDEQQVNTAMAKELYEQIADHSPEQQVQIINQMDIV